MKWLTKRPLLQKPRQHHNMNLLTTHNKRPKLQAAAKEVQVTMDGRTSTSRNWNEMDHDILVRIMKLSGFWVIYTGVAFVCKSWLLAILDALFPPGPVLDLRLYDEIPKFEYSTLWREKYFHFLKLALDFRPPIFYTKILFCDALSVSFPWEYLAKRLPSVNCIVFPTSAGGNFSSMHWVLLHWRNLEEVCCNFTFLKHLANVGNSIHSLTLYGHIYDCTASLIAENFPALKRLMIPSCVLTVDGFSTILDGHKNLEYLDTTHCRCVDVRKIDRFSVNDTSLSAKEWSADLYLKVARIKTHVQCSRRSCLNCSRFY